MPAAAMADHETTRGFDGVPHSWMTLSLASRGL